MMLKPLRFHGDAQDRLRDFPEEARSDAGFELFRVQEGKEPRDWKPMSSIGAGVREIRARDNTGAYRVIYVASFADAVHVLHAFQKRSQKTGTRDIEVARTRFRRLK
jgi:phage-related protein